MIDILTSSIILDERDFFLYQNFYTLFGIRTDFCRENLDSKKKKIKYAMIQICYMVIA